MAASVQRGGLGSLYWGYAPFLFKALPYDTTELFTYSQLREHREHLPLLRDLSENSADLLLGAPAPAPPVLPVQLDCRIAEGDARSQPLWISGTPLHAVLCVETMRPVSCVPCLSSQHGSHRSGLLSSVAT